MCAHDLLPSGVGVVSNACAQVHLQAIGEVAGVHAQEGTAPITGQIGRGALGDDDVVHEARGEEIEPQVVGEGIQCGYAATVHRGDQIAIGKAAHRDEGAHRAHATDAFHSGRNIGIAGAQHRFTPNGVDGTRRVHLQAVQVGVGPAVRLALHFELLQRYTAFAQHHVQYHHFAVQGVHCEFLRIETDEGDHQHFGCSGLQWQRVVTIQIGHRANAAIALEHDGGANERFTLGVGDLAAHRALCMQCTAAHEEKKSEEQAAHWRGREGSRHRPWPC